MCISSSNPLCEVGIAIPSLWLSHRRATEERRRPSLRRSVCKPPPWLLCGLRCALQPGPRPWPLDADTQPWPDIHTANWHLTLKPSKPERLAQAKNPRVIFSFSFFCHSPHDQVIIGHISSACKTYPSSIPFSPPLPLTLWTKPSPSSSAPLDGLVTAVLASRLFSTESGIFKTYYFPAPKHPKAALRIKSIVLTVAHKAIRDPAADWQLSCASVLPAPPTHPRRFSCSQTHQAAFHLGTVILAALLWLG